MNIQAAITLVRDRRARLAVTPSLGFAPGVRTSFPVRQSLTGKFAVLAAASIGVLAVTPSSLAQSVGGSASGFTIEEIVVTARKRPEGLQDAPISITAVTGEALELRQINSSDKLAQVTPNLTFDANAPTSGHSGAAQIYIRGIGQQDFLGVVDPGVGVYVDGVYYARTIATVFDFLDVERIEVLRGPQGTLFGRNTIGGAITIHSRKPVEELEAEAGVKIGSDSLVETRINLSGPLADNLLGRVTLGSKNRDGYVERLRDGVDLGDDDMITGRGMLLWTPAHNLEVFLSADYLDKDENGAPLVFGGINNAQVAPQFAAILSGCLPPTPARLNDRTDPACPNDQFAAGPYANNGTGPTTSEITQWGLNSTVEWDVSDSLTFKSITAYREMEDRALRDSDNTPLLVFHSVLEDEQEQFSQELQLLGNSLDQRLQWILGAYYFKEKIANHQPVFLGANPVLFRGGAGPVVPQSFQVDFDAENKAIAAFAQATYDLTEQLSLTAGLRYTDEKKSILPDQRVLSSLLAFPPGHHFVPNAEKTVKFDDLTPMVNLSYQWTNDLMAYATYSEGFKSGGLNGRNILFNANAEVTPFDPEQAQTFELGLKSSWLDNRLTLNGAYFNTKYDDIHLTVRLGIAPTVFNGGQATIQGFELEGTFLPDESWLITAGVGHLGSEYDAIDPTLATRGVIGVTEDDQLPLSPKWSANIGVAYTQTFGNWVLTPRIDWIYTDKKFFDAENNTGAVQAGVNLFNAALALDAVDYRWSLVFAVTNLTDKLYLTAATDATGTGLGYLEHVYARPREISLQAKYRF